MFKLNFAAKWTASRKNLHTYVLLSVHMYVCLSEEWTANANIHLNTCLLSSYCERQKIMNFTEWKEQKKKGNNNCQCNGVACLEKKNVSIYFAKNNIIIIISRLHIFLNPRLNRNKWLGQLSDKPLFSRVSKQLVRITVIHFSNKSELKLLTTYFGWNGPRSRRFVSRNHEVRSAEPVGWWI